MVENGLQNGFFVFLIAFPLEVFNDLERIERLSVGAGGGHGLIGVYDSYVFGEDIDFASPQL